MKKIVILIIINAFSLCILPFNAKADEPLVQKSNLTYLGAFKLPAVPYGGGYGATYGFDYAKTGIAYNPAHNSLFINNHIYEQKTAEVSIPPLSTDMNNLQTGTFLQNFVDLTQGHLLNIDAGGSTDSGTVYMGGLMVYNSKIYGTAYEDYDAALVAQLSHFYTSTNLSQLDFHGMYKVGNVNPGFVGGYMTPIPSEWQSSFGGHALTGQCCIAIISRSSYGPAAFVFNPEDLGKIDPVPATPVVYYDQDHQTLGEWGGTTPNQYFNMATSIQGIVFPTGTKSVLFFGTQGLGTPCYGCGGSTNPGGECANQWCYDPVFDSKGTHAYPYSYWVWAYSADDLLAVKNGQKNPWDIRPYAVWSLDMPISTGSAAIQGVAYDPKTQRIYVSQVGAEGLLPGAGEYDMAPLIQVFQVNNAQSSADSTTPAPPKGLRVR